MNVAYQIRDRLADLESKRRGPAPPQQRDDLSARRARPTPSAAHSPERIAAC